ncbi:MAG: sodium:calcium antiporter [Deltaproteobacteria bacterium]|nr:sodium:calcium antiporter [Deltaproteobacteria bacterium]
MLLSSLIFIISLLILLVSARFLTGAAEKLGLYFGMSSFVTGVFIVGIGTSLPELVTGVLAGLSGNSEIVSGNVLGANISNIFLILGLIAVLSRKGIELDDSYIMVDLNFLIGSSLLLGLIMMDGEIVFSEGLFLLAVYAVYSCFLLKCGQPFFFKKSGNNSPDKTVFPFKALLILLASGVGIYIGADYTVESIIEIAKHLAVPPSLISLTALSIGTTLPELAVSITMLQQGKSAIAVGNILGSCVFNALVIPGIVSVFGAIQVPEYLIGFSLPMFVVASILFYLLTHDKKISPSEGLLFLVFYAFFISKAAAFFI